MPAIGNIDEEGVRVEVSLFEDVMTFIARWGLSDTQFGELAVNSSRFVFTLRDGRQPRPATEAKVREFMARGDPGIRRGISAWALGMEAAKRNADDDRQASVMRQTDPVEIAKKLIRSRGWHCFEAAIIRPEEHGKFFVGRKLMTRDEMMEFAARQSQRAAA